jgi:hypothetical protein
MRSTHADLLAHLRTVDTVALNRYLTGGTYVPGGPLYVAALEVLQERAQREHDATPRVLTFASYPVTVLGVGHDAAQRFVRVLPTGQPSLRTGLPVANPDKVRHVRADLLRVQPVPAS